MFVFQKCFLTKGLLYNAAQVPYERYLSTPVRYFGEEGLFIRPTDNATEREVTAV
jgi:hypothetical protein